MSGSQSFFATMLDLSFQEFITIRIVKVLYVLLLLLVGIWALAILIGGLASGRAIGMLGGVVGAPIAFILGALGARVYMELLIVFFRIAENTDTLVQMKSVTGGTN